MRVVFMDDDIIFLNKIRFDFINYFQYIEDKISTNIISKDFMNMGMSKVDIAFIDIDLVVADGIDIAKNIVASNPNVVIIFISCREEFVYRTFSTKVFQFIRKKSYDNDKMIVFRQLKEYLENRNNKKIIISNGRYYAIKLDQIKYILSIGHDVFIYEEEEMVIKSSIKQLLKEFDSPSLVQIQRSLIINLNFISQFKRTKILTKDGKEYLIGRRYQQELTTKYEEYLLCC